jgi:hypothetical protein
MTASSRVSGLSLVAIGTDLPGAAIVTGFAGKDSEVDDYRRQDIENFGIMSGRNSNIVNARTLHAYTEAHRQIWRTAIRYTAK